MKNPFVFLKEKEEQQALFTVFIVGVTAVLFFLLVSIDAPVKKEVTTAVPQEIEIRIFETEPVEFIQKVDVNNSSQISNKTETVNTNHTPIKSTDNTETIQNKMDEYFHFEATNSTNNNDSKFGVTNLADVKTSTKPVGKTNLKRKVIKKPVFNAQSQEEGTIAMKIWVNQKGEVVKAQMDPEKSNSGNKYLVLMAAKAAKTMLYEEKPNSAIEFVGTKLFVFKKM